MDSKFINSQTMEYLKSRAGATTQQQIQNIRERLNIEANSNESSIKELTNRTNALGVEILTLQDSLSNLELNTSAHANNAFKANAVTSDSIKKLTISVIILAIGVLACLAKLLI